MFRYASLLFATSSLAATTIISEGTELVDVASTSVNAQTNIGLDHKEEVTIGKPRKAKKGIKGGKVRKMKNRENDGAILEPEKKINSRAMNAAIVALTLASVAVIDRVTGSHAQKAVTELISNLMKQSSNPEDTKDPSDIPIDSFEQKKAGFFGNIANGFKSSWTKFVSWADGIETKKRADNGEYDPMTW